MPPRNAKRALTIALLADLVQLAIFPWFGWGAIIPLNAAVDVILCLVLTRLVGWHIAFLPCFIMELTPIVTLVPSWTLAVMIANRRLKTPPAAPSESVAPPVQPGGVVIDV
jgi:hypothetical protein